MVIVMIFIAVFVVAKPYIPKLPLKTGDVVMIGGTMGKVDLITIMHTRIRTFDGKVVYIPNHKVLNDQVVNTSLRPKRRLDIDFYVPLDAHVDKVKGDCGRNPERIAKSFRKGPHRAWSLTNLRPGIWR